MTRWLPWWTVAVCGACATQTFEVFSTCTLDVALDPTAAAAGDTVTATGGPFTIERDTRVEIGGVAAEVEVVERTGCDTCDTCRVEAECAPCGPCFGEEMTEDARDACFGDPLAVPPIEPVCDACVELLGFVVPAGLPAGPTAVWVVNSNGGSELVPFEVLASAGSTGDTGGTADTSGAGDTSDTGGDTSDTATP